jgi:hypothetical protein
LRSADSRLNIGGLSVIELCLYLTCSWVKYIAISSAAAAGMLAVNIMPYGFNAHFDDSNIL